jgi:hypothetical protein
MNSPYDRLGISPSATPDQVKAAYHAKLKEFPAHRHPEEFKAIRVAYDEIRKGKASDSDEFFFFARPIDVKLDENALAQLRQRVLDHLEINVEELIRKTF